MRFENSCFNFLFNSLNKSTLREEKKSKQLLNNNNKRNNNYYNWLNNFCFIFISHS